MDIVLEKSQITSKKSSIAITGSKSESNRLLVLRALFPDLVLNNLSNSDDTQVLQAALNSKSEVIDIHHAGTAMRFLTAYYASKEERQVVLTGSERMQERPIKLLVDALRVLGADIRYLNNKGFPPMRIHGKRLTQNKASLPANVSSQYISALLLIAPRLDNGIEVELLGEISSLPYIKMTLSLLEQIGVETQFKENKIHVGPLHSIKNTTNAITVESDWSSASYFYSFIALSEIGTQIQLSSYKQNSLQGDSALVEIYRAFGVETKFDQDAITLIKVAPSEKDVNLDLCNTPDLAQTIAVSCLGLGIGCHLSGLHTLKIKETDRLQALKNEMEKFGADVTITEDTLTLNPVLLDTNDTSSVTINTYNDHRMAMAFAPLVLKTSFRISNADVVSKSYPEFWKDLTGIGLDISEF